MKTDCPIPPSISPVTKHEDRKEANLATQEVQENDFVGGAGPRNMNIITTAAPKCAEDGIDGNIR